MSLNKYDANTGTLTTLANGQRIWLGTKAAHDAAEAAGTLPTNCLIAITDDGDIGGVVDFVEEDNMNAVTSNAVFERAPFRFGIDEHGNYGYYKNGSNVLIPFTGRLVTVHGGINEVVTIDNGYSITLDDTGAALATLTVGTHALTGSLSGKTFTVEVQGHTDDIYCMPNNGEGILYWFGNEMTPMMFNRDTYTGTLTRETNRLVISRYLGLSNNNGQLVPVNKINLNNYSKINAIVQYGDTTSYFQYLGYGDIGIAPVWSSTGTAVTPSTSKQEVSYNFASGIGTQYCGYETNCHPNGTYFYALWLDPR